MAHTMFSMPHLSAAAAMLLIMGKLSANLKLKCANALEILS